MEFLLSFQRAVLWLFSVADLTEWSSMQLRDLRYKLRKSQDGESEWGQTNFGDKPPRYSFVNISKATSFLILNKRNGPGLSLKSTYKRTWTDDQRHSNALWQKKSSKNGGENTGATRNARIALYHVDDSRSDVYSWCGHDFINKRA